jgi:hypothetical protein
MIDPVAANANANDIGADRAQRVARQRGANSELVIALVPRSDLAAAQQILGGALGLGGPVGPGAPFLGFGGGGMGGGPGGFGGGGGGGLAGGGGLGDLGALGALAGFGALAAGLGDDDDEGLGSPFAP